MKALPILIIGTGAALLAVKGLKLSDTYYKLDVYPSANPRGIKYEPLTTIKFEIPVELVNHSPNQINLGFPSARFFVNGTNVGYSEPNPGNFTVPAKGKKSFTMACKVMLGSALFAKFTSNEPIKVDMEIFGSASGIEYTYKYPITF